ncbi:MAG: hypothetical protein LBS07_05980 [Prevotellaceae bacterium]|jgi:hypothetical protein|nr:hypothetical protein [Prevotellaceae bacterium]
MKKNIVLTAVSAMLVFASCDYNKNFDGLDELVNKTEAVTYEYTIVENDFATMASELNKNKNAADSTVAKLLAANKLFSVDAPASVAAPYLLKTKFAGATKGSAAKVTYNYKEDYDTTTVAETDKYTLQTDDYAAMGTESGMPGKYNNFDANMDIDFYISTWLKINYLYAKQGDVKLIRYKYYASSVTKEVAKVYQFTGVWKPVATSITKTEQFVFAGWENGGWVFDPTIRVTMKKGIAETDDYMLVAYYVKEKYGDAKPDVLYYYGTAFEGEYHFGFIGYYGNISWRESDRLKDPDYAALGDDAAAKEAFLTERTNRGMSVYLSVKFPETPVTVSGIEVHALVTTIIYDGNVNTTWVYDMKRVDNDDPELKWEFVGREKP